MLYKKNKINNKINVKFIIYVILLGCLVSLK